MNRDILLRMASEMPEVSCPGILASIAEKWSEEWLPSEPRDLVRRMDTKEVVLAIDCVDKDRIGAEKAPAEVLLKLYWSAIPKINGHMFVKFKNSDTHWIYCTLEDYPGIGLLAHPNDEGRYLEINRGAVEGIGAKVEFSI